MVKRRTPPCVGSGALRGAGVVAAALLMFAVQSASADVTWVGGAGSDWFTAENWSDGAVPTSSSGLIMIANGDTVVLDGSASTTANSLQVQGGSTLEVLSGTTNIGLLRIVSTSGIGTLRLAGGVLNYSSAAGSGGQNGGNIAILSGTLASTDKTKSNDIFGNISISEGGTWQITTGNDAAKTAIFGFYAAANVTISGGQFLIDRGVVTGRDSATLGNFVSQIALTSGTFSAHSLSQNKSQFNISGGKFIITGDVTWSGTTVVSGSHNRRAINVVGGLGEVSVGGNYTNPDGLVGSREFVLTAKNSGVLQENISKINVGGTDSAGGDLKTSLQGGILLANPTEYTLISAGTLSGAINYTGSTLYTGAAVGNDYKITLNTALKQGDLEVTELNSPVDTTFAQASVGYVDLDLTSVFDDASELLIRWDANAGGGTIEGLVEYMSQSGYSDVAEDASGDYNISFTVSGDFLSDETMYLAWDLLEFDPGAGVAGLQVTVIPEPNAIYLLSAAGAALFLRRFRSGPYRLRR